MAIERISGGGHVSYVQGGALGGGAEGACVPRILAVLIPRIPGGSRRASADGERARGCWWGGAPAQGLSSRRVRGGGGTNMGAKDGLPRTREGLAVRIGQRGRITCAPAPL